MRYANNFIDHVSLLPAPQLHSVNLQVYGYKCDTSTKREQFQKKVTAESATTNSWFIATPGFSLAAKRFKFFNQ